MQQLTDEEKARVFHLYHNARVTTAWQKDANGHDYGAFKYWHIDNERVYVHPAGLWNDRVANDAKLLLTPLSAVTEEHAIEVGVMLGYGQTPTRPSFVARVKGKSFIEYWSDNFGNANPVITTAIFQYLIQQGYAVPVFISLNHPLNGLNPIELGIAIDATTI